MKHFRTITEVYKTIGFPPPENPLLGVLTFEDIRDCNFVYSEFTMGFYKIALKKMNSGTLTYGKTKYDSDTGSMFFMKPNQILQMNDLNLEEKGFIIFIDEDYLVNHSLHAAIKKYSYFDYETNEALHLSPKEEGTIWDLFNKIREEYYNNQDNLSKEIMIGYIESILKYSSRFYNRQFINRTVMSGTIISKFTEILGAYFESGNLQKHGLPTVNYMASKLSLSAGYLSDLLKQETGRTALDHIHTALVVEAKNILMSTDNTVAETAFQLGFENPPYFSRLFKKAVGITPTEYRNQLLN